MNVESIESVSALSRRILRLPCGSASMRDYTTYVESRYRDEFDEYLVACDEYDARNAGVSFNLKDDVPQPDKKNMPEYDPNAKGQAVQGLRFGYPGLWDADKRTCDLDADGIAAEVIFPQGSVPFGAYPALGSRTAPVLFELERDDLRVAGSRMYNRGLPTSARLIRSATSV